MTSVTSLPSESEIHTNLLRREPHTIVQFFLGGLVFTLSQIATGIFLLISTRKIGMKFSQLEDHVMFLLAMSLGALLSVVGFIITTRYLSQRKVFEFSGFKALRELGIGLVIGAVLVSIPVLVLWALGMYTVTGVGFTPAMFSALAIGIGAGFMEEILFRGVFLRLVERATGTWAALALSALAFGLVHASNPNVSLLGSVTIGVEAGLLLGATYLVTRRLWMAIGVHAAWNFVQGGVWSSPVSGLEQDPGLIHGTFSGPEILTGGAMGIEGSILALIVCLIAAVLLLRTTMKRNYIIKATNWPPRWKKEKGETRLENSAA